MAFSIYESFLFTGVPTLPIANLPRAYTNAAPKVINSDGTPNFENAATLVANAQAARAELLIIDAETELTAKIDQREIGNSGGPADQAEIDRRLDSVIAVYNFIKTLTTMKVGWYGLHLRSYYIPVNYRDKNTGASEYAAWEAAHDRWNYRAVGSALRSGFPINKGFDVAITDVYCFFGPNDPHVKSYIRENLYVMKRTAAGTKPVYAMLWPEFHDTSSWAGYTYPAGYMTNVIECASVCEGAVVWGGFGVSATTTNLFTPTTTVKAAWQAVTNGSLSLRYAGVTLALTGMDFSGYVYPDIHMEGVASQLQTYINAAVTAYNAQVPTIGEPGYATNRPYNLPACTVTWDGTKFLMSLGANVAAPFDNYYGKRVVVNGSGSVNTMMGTRSESVTNRNTDEFSSWVANQPWYLEVLDWVAPSSRESPAALSINSSFNTVNPEVIDNGASPSGFVPHL